MSYKLLNHDDNAFHLMHKDGTQFSIAKKGLSKPLQDKIHTLYGQGVQHFDEGTVDVEPDAPNYQLPSKDVLAAGVNAAQQMPEQSVNAPGITDTLKGGVDAVGDWLGAPAGTPMKMDDRARPKISEKAGASDMAADPQLASYEPADSSAPPASPDKPQDPYLGVPGMADEAKALEKMSGMRLGQSTDIDAAQKEKAKQLADHQAIWDKQAKDLNAEHDARKQAVMDAKVDPTRMFHNLSDGQRVMALIGLALSGRSAPDLLNKFVDRDIEAQKADLGKKQSLLANNLQKTRDMRAAEAETRLQLNSALQGQIQASAVRSSNGAAALNAQIALAQLKMQAPQYAQAVLEQRMRQSLVQGGEIPPQAAEMLPEKARERAVIVPGEHGPKLALAPTTDAKKEYDKISNGAQEMKAKIRDSLRFMTSHGTVLNPFSQASGTAQTLHNDMVTTLGKVGDLARFTPEEAKRYEQMVPDPGQWNTSKGIAQLQQLDKILTDKLNAAAGTYLENYNPGKFQLAPPVRK